MKKFTLLLALMLLLTACAEVPPPADTAPPQTTEPVVEITARVETIPETTTPTVITGFTPYGALISYDAQPNWLARSLGCLFVPHRDRSELHVLSGCGSPRKLE